MIEVKNLSKEFKSLNRKEGLFGSIKDLFSNDYTVVKAVDNITMRIDDGEIVGFAGPNGAGKSTTIKMLTGVLKPSNGTINVNGFTPFKERMRYMQSVGVVFGQRTQLWWEIPVIESFKLLKEIYKIPQNEFDENLKLFDDLVNLSDLYNKPVRQMSLGQRMLCDIAASFLHNPKIIFLDEPTIGLDISIKSKIRKIIKDLNSLKGTTILLTTHDVGDMEELCKRIILIDKGSLIYDGEIDAFNRLFGTYRTLKVSTELNFAEDLTNSIKRIYQKNSAIKVKNSASGWIETVIDQDKLKLTDVLTTIMNSHPIKDVKIQEIEMENIIQKIYEGGINEKVSLNN